MNLGPYDCNECGEPFLVDKEGQAFHDQPGEWDHDPVLRTEDIGTLILDQINRTREDPETPRCAVTGCDNPGMMVVCFGDDLMAPPEEWKTLCEDCDTALLWSRNGWISTIKKILEPYDIRTGELRANA